MPTDLTAEEKKAAEVPRLWDTLLVSTAILEIGPTANNKSELATVY